MVCLWDCMVEVGRSIGVWVDKSIEIGRAVCTTLSINNP